MSDKFFAERVKKIKDWEELGFAGYAKKFDRTHNSAQAKEFCAQNKAELRDAKTIMEDPQKVAKMCGRITNFRSMGKLAFLRIIDPEGDFQICLTKNVLGDLFKKAEKIFDLGDFAGFEGEFFLTNHGEPTLLVQNFTPLAKTLRPLPEKWAGLSDREACYRERNLDLVSNRETFERFKLRSAIIREIRDFFHQKDFMEIETRILQPQAGGAMAKVFETHHNALDHDFVLRISLELDLKMAVGGGLERVFEIGKNFRNEGIDPSHLQEFTMIEWYAAYQDLNTNMDWTEEMIRTILQNTLQKTTVEIVRENGEKITVDFAQKIPRKKFADLLQEYAGVDMFKISRAELETLVVKKYGMSGAEAAKTSRGNLLDHIYKQTARPNLLQPVFVTDYPSELKPLARPNGDGTAECAQLLVAGWEITNAYGELVDPRIQRKLLEDQAAAKAQGDEETMDIDEVFLSAMEHGFPPMTGFGMGIDRFVALITQQPNLKDVVLFPLMRPE